MTEPTVRAAAPHDLPDVNSLVHIRCGDCLERHRSRVEERDGLEVSVSAPHLLGPHFVGRTFALIWGTAKGRHRMPVTITADSEGTVPLWRLAPGGPVETTQARRFVRVPMVGDVEVRSTERAETVAVPAQLYDLSEGGVRCRAATGALHWGEGVEAVITISSGTLTRSGRVLRLVVTVDGLDDVVIEFEPDTRLEDHMRVHLTAVLRQRRRQALD